ncbi:polysaccharide export outer membrane protein [Flavobacteriales bacterium ALC-1]|nr:polysaccharide export outer membrane protein [Flavobacteriales bacterium ALC-1]
MKTRFFLISILSLIIATSCASRKKIVYFQDEPINESLEASTLPSQLIYKPGDILTINVSAFDQEAIAPFNLTIASSNSDNPNGLQGSMQLQPYLVDYIGNIEFPVLGTIKVGGLTRAELTSMLTTRIKEYTNDPIVNVRLSNFTITILGEVSNPGTFTIKDEQITIIEAIGLANDLTIFGKRQNVRLIRDVNGKKKFAEIDLTSINTINSPVYYLQQNDVIYVEPNNAKIRSSTYNQNNGVLISAIGTLTTILAIFLVK